MQTADLNDLRDIAAIAAAGSLAGAARALGVNHATIYRRLEAIEAHLGVRLFEREGGRYATTAAGEELARIGEAITAQAEDGLRKVAGQDLRASGEVRLTTTDTVAGLVMPLLRDCRLRWPEIRLQLLAANSFLSLARRDADIAVRPTDAPPEQLIGRRIGTLAMAAYGARTFMARLGPRPLAEQQWIALDDSLGAHRTLAWLAGVVALPSVALRVNSLALAARACADGLGLAVLPCFLGDQLPDLQRVTAPIPACATGLWLLMHPDLRDMARVRLVWGELGERLGAKTALLAGECPQDGHCALPQR